MEYELAVVQDTDPKWNPSMDAWWNGGGALLWNQYGGFGKDRLILTNEDLQSFMEQARGIFGWQPCSSGEGNRVGPGNPILVQPRTLQDELPQADEAHASESQWCCRDCARPVHEALNSPGRGERLSVSRRDLNHVLNSLQEAIDFSRGKGPNNSRTWEAALEDLTTALKE